MIDFGFDKIALISAVALIVIGPEKLPRVARTVGHLIGKAQRYVADVKAEVNRSIELEEFKQDEDRRSKKPRATCEQTVSATRSIRRPRRSRDQSWNDSVRTAAPQRSARTAWQHTGARSTGTRRRTGV